MHAIGINFGSVRITTSEVRTALSAADPRTGGAALRRQIEQAALTTRERSRFLDGLLRYTQIGDGLGETEGDAVHEALAAAPEIAMCLQIVAELRPEDAAYDRVRDRRQATIVAWGASGAIGDGARECVLELSRGDAERSAALERLSEYKTQVGQ